MAIWIEQTVVNGQKWARSVQRRGGTTFESAPNPHAAAAGMVKLVSGVIFHQARDRSRDGKPITESAILDNIDRRTRGKV